MPINVFGNSWSISDYKNDTSLFVQKPALTIKFIESNLEEDIDKKKHYRFENSEDPSSIREPSSENYVDNKYKMILISMM